jgi:predicted DNA-binding protein
MEKEFVSASLRWPADLKAELDRRARDEDRTFTSYVIHALRQHIKNTPEPKRKVRG